MRPRTYFVSLAAVLVLAGTVHAGVHTTVSLVTQDDTRVKPALPWLAVTIVAPDVRRASLLDAALQSDLPRLVHARLTPAGQAPDYRLRVTLLVPDSGVSPTSQPFEASLVDRDGTIVWRVAGETTSDGAALDEAAILNLGRNVVSALIRDGWLQAKYDPNDPPPAPPLVQRNDK